MKDRSQRVGPIGEMDQVDTKKYPFNDYVWQLLHIINYKNNESQEVNNHLKSLIQQRFKGLDQDAARAGLKFLALSAITYPYVLDHAFLESLQEEVESKDEEIERHRAQLEVVAAAHEIDAEVYNKKRKMNVLEKKIKESMNWDERLNLGLKPHDVEEYIAGLNAGEGVLRHSKDKESRATLHYILRDYTFDAVQEDTLSLEGKWKIMEEAERRGYVTKEERIAHRTVAIAELSKISLAAIKKLLIWEAPTLMDFKRDNYLFMEVAKVGGTVEAGAIRDAAIQALHQYMNGNRPYLEKEAAFNEIRQMDVFTDVKSRGFFSRRSLDERLVPWDNFITQQCNEVRKAVAELDKEFGKKNSKKLKSISKRQAKPLLSGDPVSDFFDFPSVTRASGIGKDYETRKLMIEKRSGSFDDENVNVMQAKKR